MLTHDAQVRIRYGEVDMMGFLYHSHYVELFDVGRTELMRHYDFPYCQIEAAGVMMPVLQVHIDYRNPAHYDDMLTIRTYLSEMPTGVRIKFNYEVYRQNTSELITTGHVILAFMNAQTHRPTRCPAKLLETISPHFK